MKSLKHRVTFKILIGYLILGISSTFFGYLVLSEIKSFTLIQEQDLNDNNKILKVGSIIADIYENESLGRAAIQLNSTKKFNQYLKENDQLLLKIDSLNFFVNNKSQEFIVDSIKVVINKKLKNLKDLKRVKRSYNSEESITSVIDKLSSIDSILNKAFIDDILKKIEFLNSKKRIKFRKFRKELEKQNLDTINFDQKKIDSLIAVSKNLLKKTQKKATNQRISLLRKEKQLIANDLIISRKLRELLNTLKKGIMNYTNEINQQKEKSFSRSRKIILAAAAISLLIIIIFSIIFLNDFWKNQRYRKQLEKANKTTSSLLKSREQLISMVSHDLRTPLSTISGYSELLQKTIYNTKEKNYLEHIGNASSYMKELVDDLMEFSKLESGTITFKSVPFNLEKTINETISSAITTLQNKPVELIVEHDHTIKNAIISDPFRLKQILNNLITNACKFTNEGSVTIKSNLKRIDHKNNLEIAIIDTGLGIPKNQQETIFKAFTQVDSNDNKNGFGLGLTISKKLIELLKGTLTLKSEVDKGSTFTLNIPVKLSEEPIKETKKHITNTTFNLSAIIVEDDASVRQLLKDILNQYNIKTHIFNDAQEALDNIGNIYYDIVFTDIQLPKMNGIRFKEILIKNENYDKQPIIAMTGRLNLSKEDYLKIGFSEILSKPFKTSEIQDILQQFTKTKLKKEQSELPLNENEIFNTSSLEAFFNNDHQKIKNTLTIFLEDTKNNSYSLKKAKENNDIKTFNAISHKMVSMFKQLNVKNVIPFLENFETTTSIDNKLFIDFENNLEKFKVSLEEYLN